MLKRGAIFSKVGESCYKGFCFILRGYRPKDLTHWIKGCLVWGSRTSILTSYLESAGFFGVKTSSSSSSSSLWKYHNIHTASKVGTVNPLNWWHCEVTILSHIVQKMDFSSFFRRVHTSFWETQSQSASLNASNWQFESQSALTFSEIVF